MYISVKDASQKYNKAEKTIRRLYGSKTKPIKLSRSQAYKNKKGEWLFNTEWLDKKFEQSTVTDTEQPKVTSQSSDNFQAILAVLEKQLAEKDKQLERLDSKLDQQQKLTAGIQTQLNELSSQLLISEPQNQPKTTESINTRPTTQKPVKRAVNVSKSKPKAKPKTKEPVKKKHWWRRG